MKWGSDVKTSVEGGVEAMRRDKMLDWEERENVISNECDWRYLLRGS